MPRWVQFNAEDICAVITDAPGGGDYTDPAAPRNRPAIDPGNWLANVQFHDGCDHYELLDTVQAVTITHALLATASTLVISGPGISLSIAGQSRYTDVLLYEHDKGFVPPYMIAWNGARLAAGTHIQIDGTGNATRSRCVSHFATSTGIYLREHAISSTVDLAAINVDYQVMIFNRPAADPDLPQFQFDNAAGVAKLGRGKTRTDRQYLRGVLAGESSFDINLGATMDINNGFIRSVSGGVAYTEPGYGGGFAGPAFVPVGGVF